MQPPPTLLFALSPLALVKRGNNTQLGGRTALQIPVTFTLSDAVGLSFQNAVQWLTPLLNVVIEAHNHKNRNGFVCKINDVALILTRENGTLWKG